MAGGGKILEYGGPTHEESPIGGIPVDGNGNVTSLNNAKALFEEIKKYANMTADELAIAIDNNLREQDTAEPEDM